MTENQGTKEPFGCPHMNLNDPRCARHFSLSRIDEAFSICLNGYTHCETYHQLQVEHAGGPQTLTIAGRRIQAGRSNLRRTGS